MNIIPIAMAKDNYGYLLVEEGRAVVVDPTEVEPVEAKLRALGAKPEAIWITHHHHDHIGGIDALYLHHAVPVVAGIYDLERGRIPRQSIGLADGQSVSFAGHAFKVFHTPGHTQGAVCFACDHAILTGDTLFLAGCGRLLEGSAAELHQSLQRLASLDPHLQVYCGHEYTLTNLRFAKQVEPGNAAVRAALERMEESGAQLKSGNQPHPSTLADQLETNPFLRTYEPTVVAYARRCAKQHVEPGEATFAALRKARDHFN